MPLFRRWFLLLFMLIMGGGQLFASSREERAYAAALQAFHDQFYGVAGARLNQFLQTYPRSTNAPMAVLLLAQSDFYLKNYSLAASRLSNPANLAAANAAGLADRYVYWQAQAQFAQADFSGAAQTFGSLAEKFPNSTLALDATVAAAAARKKLAQWPQVDAILESTNGPFQRMARLDPYGALVANGRLLLAESKYRQRDFAAALRALNRLNPAMLTPEQDWQRAHLLYSASLGLNDLNAALSATTNLLEIARLEIARPVHDDDWVANLAESVACNADVLERQDRLSEATAAWQKNQAPAVPVAQQQQAILKLAGLAIAQNNLTNAESRLEQFLEQIADTNSLAAQTALLTLGELYLTNYLAEPSPEGSHLTNAVARLDQFLACYTNSPLTGRAYLARGWCSWLMTNYAECFTNFQAAADHLPVSDDLAIAKFKMGDAQFALANFSAATNYYLSVLTDFAGWPNVRRDLAPPALYQILRARLQLDDANGVDEAMRQFLGAFFASAPAESALLLAGQGFSSFGLPARARAVFQQFEAERTNSPLLPQVAFALARTYDGENNWPEAVARYEAWLQDYPTNEWRCKVEFARASAVAQTGDEARAFGLFADFITRFTNNAALTPVASWWVADHYFRLGTNFTAAETNYLFISQYFPAHALAYPAQLMAGRAALGLLSYNDAKGDFLNVLGDTNCPELYHDQARFAYCEVLRDMAATDTNNASLQIAVAVLAQMTPKAATNIAGALAWSETADLEQLMGAFDAATNAYAQVLNSPPAQSSRELLARAQVGLGDVLQRKAEAQGLTADARNALLAQAMDCYGNVFYSDNELNDARWTKQAGWQMFALARQNGLLKGTNFISRFEAVFPQLTNSLELKRLADKN